MAYGLLPLQERSGPWVLDGAVSALVAVLDGEPVQAADTMFELLGLVTDAVIAAPLAPQLHAAARRIRARPSPTTTR